MVHWQFIKHLQTHLILQALVATPIEGMFESGGWAGQQPWAVWMATGGGLLWITGGLLVPNGVLLRKPIDINVIGKHSGLLVAGNSRVYPIAMGNIPRHPLTQKVLESVVSFLCPT